MKKRSKKKSVVRKASTATKKKISSYGKVTKQPKIAKATTKKKATRKKKIPASYSKTKAGVLAPSDQIPVSPEKIKSGLVKARREINNLINSIGDITDGYSMSEIELSASFSADGKFLGIGVGGATTIKIKFTPEHDK